MNALQKITKARAGLVLSSPFFASIALRLRLKEDTEQDGVYTDSVVLGYNPARIDSLTVEEVRTIIVHEVLHIALLHPFRRQQRNYRNWQVACDYAINPMVEKAGHRLPEGAIYNSRFEGLDAETIYAMLDQKSQPSSGKDNESDNHGKEIGDVRDYVPNDSQDKDNKADTPEQGYDESVIQRMQETKIQVSQAAKVAQSQGNMPGFLDRKIKDILNPKLPWQEILARFVTEHSKNDYNWMKPNKRYMYSDIYLPDTDDPKLGFIAVIVDTSGSIRQKQLDVFAAELMSILMSYPSTEIEVIYVDTKVAGTQTINPNELELKAKGGGGTDFRPGYKYIDDNNINPVCVLYFTDGYCFRFPEEEPDYPTLWIITSTREFNPPFGEVVSLNQ